MINSNYFKNHFDESTLTLAVFEAIGIYTSFIVAAAICLTSLSFDSSVIIAEVGNIYLKALAFTIMNLVFMAVLGMYNKENFKKKAGYVDSIYKLVINLFLVSVTPIFIFSAYTTSVDQQILAIACVNISIVLIAVRRVYFWQLHGANTVPNILVIGNGKAAARMFAENALGHHSSEYSVKGFIATSDEETEGAANLTIDLGHSLLEQAQMMNIDEIVVALDDDRKNCPTQHLLDCKLAGITITDSASFLRRMERQERYYPSAFNIDA